MGTSNLDRLIVSIPDTRYHRCTSSPSYTINTASEEDQNVNSVSGGLKIQIPSSAAGEVEISNREDDPATPRSIEHRIPVMAVCPPAPRKARSVPVNRKRKTSFSSVVGVIPADFIVYVDAMFALNEAVYVPDIVVGDIGNGNHAKKLKLLPAPAPAPANDR